jgi:hypothetical protein
MFIPYPKKKKEKEARSSTIWEIWNEENYKSSFNIHVSKIQIFIKIICLDEF